MSVPNYTYLKLKMLGPNRIITIGSTYRHAYECEMECVEYAEALAESEALIVDLERLSKEAPDTKRHAGNFEPVEAIKSVSLNPSNDASKKVSVAEPPKLLGPHAPVLVSKTLDCYACAPDNLTGSVRLPHGHRINHLQPEP
jgi:hypothetical protein